MDKQYIEKLDIDKKYLMGQLSPEERIEFEEYLLDKPEVIEQLELNQIMHTGMQHAAKKEVAKGMFSWWKPIYSHTIALASSAVLCALLLVDSSELVPISKASPNILYVDNYRSTQVTHFINFKAEESYKFIVFNVSHSNGKHFTLLARNDKEDTFTLAKEVNSNDDGDLVLVLERDRLKEGTYGFVVQDEEQNQINRFKVGITFNSTK